MFAHHQKYSYERRDKPARSRSWLRYQPTEMVVVSDVTIKFNVITPQGGHGFAMNVGVMSWVMSCSSSSLWMSWVMSWVMSSSNSTWVMSWVMSWREKCVMWNLTWDLTWNLTSSVTLRRSIWAGKLRWEAWCEILKVEISHGISHQVLRYKGQY